MSATPLGARLQILNALIATGGVFDGAVLILFKNDVVIDKAVRLADLEEADYTGYARSAAVAWGTTFINTAGQAEAVGPLKQFQATGTGTTNTIYGWALLDPGTPDKLLIAERFPEPVSMLGPTSAAFVFPRLTYPPDEQ